MLVTSVESEYRQVTDKRQCQQNKSQGKVKQTQEPHPTNFHAARENTRKKQRFTIRFNDSYEYGRIDFICGRIDFICASTWRTITHPNIIHVHTLLIALLSLSDHAWLKLKRYY